jgi:hypothetical protein
MPRWLGEVFSPVCGKKMLADAKRDIDRLYRDGVMRRRRHARIRGVVHAIDDLLFELEEANLGGVDRVPPRLRERAGQLLELVPGPEDPDFRVRHRVVPMMDVLFRAQEILFKLRDPSRRSYPEDEELQDLEAVADPASKS